MTHNGLLKGSASHCRAPLRGLCAFTVHLSAFCSLNAEVDSQSRAFIARVVCLGLYFTVFSCYFAICMHWSV